MPGQGEYRNQLGRGMLGMAWPWDKVVPPGCDVSPAAAASLDSGLPMHHLINT